MKYLFLAIFSFQLAYAQFTLPAFPGVEMVDYLESTESRQYYLRKSAGAQIGDTKKVNQWLVNLEQKELETLSFVIRDPRRKILYQGTLGLNAEGKLVADITFAMPGQAVMLIFVADRVALEKGNLRILSVRNAGKALIRQDAARAFLAEMQQTEEKLGFDSWKLRQLRKFDDEKTKLPQLRAEAEKQLNLYLQK